MLRAYFWITNCACNDGTNAIAVGGVGRYAEVRQMQYKIPIYAAKKFYMYRRSDVPLGSGNKPAEVTHTPDMTDSTYLIINGLGDDWQVSPWEPHPSEVKGNPNHPIWVCVCRCNYGGMISTGPLYQL